MRRVNFIEHGIQDLRFALRQLRKHPAFACTAIVMLALGIAANVAILGFVDAALIRPLPYADQSRLVLVYATDVRKPGRGNVSYLDYPIGKAIVFGRPSATGSAPVRQIVGVVADIKDASLETPSRPAAYVPFDQNGLALVVRTTQAEDSLFPSLAAAVRDVQPTLLISALTTMTARMNQAPSAHLHRSSAWVVGGFAAMAFLLSVIGLYGVVAYSVGQRTREIGVRMALGAQRRSVYRLVMGEAAWLVGVGTALGLICAMAAARLMQGLLFGVQSWDVPTLAAAAVVLDVSALFASYMPARRAASVNPIEVLRAE